MLDDIVSAYIRQFPDERKGLAPLIEQIVQGQKLNDRKNFEGHVTGSAIVLSPDRMQVLVIYHKLFGRWQQPGGHWEIAQEADPLATARREVVEETSVVLSEYVPLEATNPILPVDIDVGAVPEQPRKSEPQHVHYDFRYVFIAQDEHVEQKPDEPNITNIGWFDFDAPEAGEIMRTIQKLRELQLIPS
ncbi:MAG TPA: NUDIX domain-containing protein [Candidatus Saccharimonadales bacterium]|nr:NUDIX domain-containing protein [Candidatus Saccharimonadales bacterium]